MVGLMHRLSATAMVALLVLATGCASGGAEASSDPGIPGTTRITVENFHSNAEDLEIFIVPDGGVARVRLGAVPRGDSGAFTFDGDRGSYRLVAIRPVGETTSDRVNVNHTTNITWNIEQNRVVVSRR
jgi:hypothetical protein